MDILANPHRGRGLPPEAGLAPGRVSRDPTDAQSLLGRCPAARKTPLLDRPELARQLGVAELRLKDESTRMGLGSFKALGAAYVIAREAARRGDAGSAPAAARDLARILEGTTYACASAGNHGLSLAAGARLFGGRAVVYLSQGVPEAFAHRLRRYGARVVRAGDDYEQSMAAARSDAERQGWTLLSDSSWPGYTELPERVMQGYLVMGAEVLEASPEPPSHIFLQAGVGGLAAAMAALFRQHWAGAPVIVVVEPDAAPALMESIRAGRPVKVDGAASIMGRLDCKQPSHLALGELARSADHFVTVTDSECAATVEWLAVHGVATTPSGAAGVAGLQHAGAVRESLGLDAASRILAFITEGPEEG